MVASEVGVTVSAVPLVIDVLDTKLSLLTTPVPPVNTAVRVVVLPLVTVVAAPLNEVMTGLGTTVSVAGLGVAELPAWLVRFSVKTMSFESAATVVGIGTLMRFVPEAVMIAAEFE